MPFSSKTSMFQRSFVANETLKFMTVLRVPYPSSLRQPKKQNIYITVCHITFTVRSLDTSIYLRMNKQNKQEYATWACAYDARINEKLRHHLNCWNEFIHHTARMWIIVGVQSFQQNDIKISVSSIRLTRQHRYFAASTIAFGTSLGIPP